MCMRAVKALASLRICADSHEHSKLANAISKFRALANMFFSMTKQENLGLFSNVVLYSYSVTVSPRGMKCHGLL